jgi:hypothetical protein
MGVAELLMDEADVDEVDSNGLTALHRAAAMGDVQVIDKLIKRGAKKEKKEARNGWTPLHVAVNSNQVSGSGGSARRSRTVAVQGQTTSCIVPAITFSPSIPVYM